MERVIRYILKLFGFGIRRLPSVKSKFIPLRITMQESLEHILNLNYYPKIIIDVGAADGTPPLLKIFPNSRFLWIEPLEEFEGALKELSRKYNGEFIITAAGKSNGTSKIKITPDLTGSSLYYKDDDIDFLSLRKTKVIRLDDLIQGHNLKEDILLKVDVQGYELEVLQGAQELIQNCEVVILEVSFFRYQKQFPDFYDVIDYMKKRSFVVYDIFDGDNRPFDNALSSADVMFVKENGRFRKSHIWATNYSYKTHPLIRHKEDRYKRSKKAI